MTRVLVIEDDPWIAALVADELADRGYDVWRATNGHEALRLVEHARPDVVVLDLMMPVMHGWDFLDRYEQAAGGTLPIVVVSAAGAVARSMERRGVRRFLPKPFDMEQLARCVAELAATRQLEGIPLQR